MSKIKICGLFRAEDAQAVNAAMPDYAGFIFVPESRRFVPEEKAAALREAIDIRIPTVGVFRNASLQAIERLYLSGVISVVQLHGTEDAVYMTALKQRLGAHVPLIKAARVTEAGVDFRGCHPLRAEAVNAGVPERPQPCPADYLLYDNGTGGTGERFDLSVLARAKKKGRLPDKPYFIAGGVSLENLHDILLQRPYGVDVSSGAETDGVKDAAKILAIVKAVRSKTLSRKEEAE
ncbi:MAG: phosphoribosylanthranilate isomerase [Clostridiales Family XIII bacterium]|jgi:phosphoribosylanthranilate isomerase|nr:phosphoribosylanthranilate isomerase [Clostridiales Family XIII bacterium]